MEVVKRVRVGSGIPGQCQLYEVPVEIGEILLVTSMSPYLRQELMELATKEFPDPDPATFDGGKDSAAYSVAKVNAGISRLSKFYDGMLSCGCVVSTADGREKSLMRHAWELEGHYRTLDIDPKQRDHFKDLVQYVLLHNRAEIQAVVNCACEAPTARDLQLGIRTADYLVEWHGKRRQYTRIEPMVQGD